MLFFNYQMAANPKLDQIKRKTIANFGFITQFNTVPHILLNEPVKHS